jgi:predicted membrane-bound spermidine synthase
MGQKKGKRASFDKEITWDLLGGIFLVSFTLIAFQIALSRLLSVLLSYNYVFAVLSLALLGLGVGGMIAHFSRPRVESQKRDFARWAFLYSVAVPVSILSITQIGYMVHLQIKLLIYGILLFIPFLFAGGLLAKVYRRFSFASGRIYGVDLIGAAVGSLGAILLLDILGGLRTHFILGGLAFVGALLLAMGEMKKNKKGVLFFLGLLVLFPIFGINLFDGKLMAIPIGGNPTKEIHDAFFTFEGRIIETKWSAFGRTDLVEYEHIPEHMDIYIDGTAGSPMYRFSGNINAPDSAVDRLKDEFSGYFPFQHLKKEEKDHALVIGPGGGRDVLLALMGGIQKITAIEINKDLVELVRKYSNFSGGIYTEFSNVKIIVDEGRNFLKRQREKYDLIMLSLPVTNTSRSLEGYALTESFLFTVESIHDYLDHLTDHGRLVVVGHNDAEILRLLSISLAALDQRGVTPVAAMKQIYVLGSEEYPLFVMKKTPFEPEEMLRAYASMVQWGYDQRSSYFPYIGHEASLNSVLAALASGRIGPSDFVEMVRERGYDISTVSDNRPFFYKFETGMPGSISLVLWFSILLCMAMIGVPSIMKKGRPDFAPFRYLMQPLFLFSFLGIGFMVIEISLIQKFGLFLGHPVLSLAVLLFSLLGGAGLGSLWSVRVRSDELRSGLGRTSFVIACIAVSYAFVLPFLFDRLLGLGLPFRILVSILAVVPLSFFMGFPFPLAIRVLKANGMEGSIPWMWGINGVGSVFGSALTLIIAIKLGFTAALLVGAGCYLMIFLIFIKIGR